MCRISFLLGLFFYFSSAHASDFISGMLQGFSGRPARPSKILQYENELIPARKPVSVQQHSLQFSSLLWQESRNSISIAANLGIRHATHALSIPQTNVEVPRDLYQAKMATNYSYRLEGAKFIGSSVSVDSPSDKPFSTWDVLSISVSGFYSFPGEKPGHRWLFLLFASNHSPFLNYVPLPGVAYIYQTESVLAVLGIPFLFLRWSLPASFTLSLSALGTQVKAELVYGHTYQIFSSIGVQKETYLRKERVNSKDQLSFREAKVALGLRTPVAANFMLTAEGGYQFDRSIYEGYGWGRKHRSAELSLATTLYAGTKLQYSF